MDSWRLFAAQCGDIETVILPCDQGVASVLTLVINILTGIIALLAVIGIVLVGLQWMSAREDINRVMKAKRRMFEIVIGLVAYMLVYTGLRFLLPGGSLDPADTETGTTISSNTGGGGNNGGGNGGNGGNGNNGGNNGGGTNGEQSFEPGDNGDGELTDIRQPDVSDDATDAAFDGIYHYYCKTNKNAAEFEHDRTTPTGNVSAENCKQEAGTRNIFNVDDFGVLLNHPIKMVSSNDTPTTPGGHHGFWHKSTDVGTSGNYWMFQSNVVTGWASVLTNPVDPNNTLVKTYYNGDASAVPLTVLMCDKVASAMSASDAEQWCYDSRTSGQEVEDMDIHHYLGISDSFYSRTKVQEALASAVGGAYSTTSYQSLDGTGVPVFAIFVPNGGSVTFTGLSAYKGSQYHCALLNFTVTSPSGRRATGYYAHMSTIAGSSGTPGVNTIVAYTGNTVCADGTSPHVHVTLHGYNLLNLVSGGKITQANMSYSSNALDLTSNGTITDVLSKHFLAVCNMNTSCQNTLKDEYIAMKNPQPVTPPTPARTDYAQRKTICQKFTTSLYPGIVTSQMQQQMQSYLRCSTDVMTIDEIKNNVRGGVCGILNAKKNDVILLNRIRQSVTGNQISGALGAIYSDLSCSALLPSDPPAPAKPTEDEYVAQKCPPLNATDRRNRVLRDEYKECVELAKKEYDEKYK